MLPAFLKETVPSSQHIPKCSYSKTANTVSLKKSSALRKILWEGERRGKMRKRRKRKKKKKRKNRVLIKILFCKHIKSCQLLNILNAHKKCAQMGIFSAHISRGKKNLSLSSSKSLNFLNLIVPLFLRIHTPRPKLSCHQSFKSDLDITREEAPSLPEVSLLLQHTKKQSIMGPC